MAIKQDQYTDLSSVDVEKLNQFKQQITQAQSHFLGYPCSTAFNYKPLYEFLDYPLNNIGDPFRESAFRINTHQFEVEVLERCARLYHTTLDEVWGYVTNGGTEGNMYGIYLAREMFPDAVVYYSEDTHYSVAKILRMLHARNIMIKSQANGEIDYDDLRETLRIYRDSPPVIFANIGTTMKGAVDNVEVIRDILSELAIHHYYIHADAALSGMILPFVDSPQAFDFQAGIDSISVSGHKMIGSPIPCGVVLAKKAHVERIARSVEYIGTLDTTLSGSRNGITPLFLWYALQLKGEKGFKDIIQQCLDHADYAIEQLASINIQAWRHENSITVVFPRLTSQLETDWQLAVHGDCAHIIIMPHVNKGRIDCFVEDIREQFKRQDEPS